VQKNSKSEKRTDVFDTKKRSEIMSRVKSKNTKPELLIRRALHKRGYRYGLHNKKLPGPPDLILPKYGIIVFIQGCFWHQYPKFTLNSRKVFALFFTT
jgi:DNA mismatch endonuclease (patch repair protein)